MSNTFTFSLPDVDGDFHVWANRDGEIRIAGPEITEEIYSKFPRKIMIEILNHFGGENLIQEIYQSLSDLLTPGTCPAGF